MYPTCDPPFPSLTQRKDIPFGMPRVVVSSERTADQIFISSGPQPLRGSRQASSLTAASLVI